MSKQSKQTWPKPAAEMTVPELVKKCEGAELELRKTWSLWEATLPKSSSKKTAKECRKARADFARSYYGFMGWFQYVSEKAKKNQVAAVDMKKQLAADLRYCQCEGVAVEEYIKAKYNLCN